ncbi:MAG: hypothetical protein ACRDVM_04465, partial [Acidimicrobiia bacterium]
MALSLPWVAVVIAARLPIRDNSFLWHIRAGTVQLERGAVLTTDPFSFTMLGEPWRTQSWLVELLYAWLEDRWGLSFAFPMVVLVVSLLLVFVGLYVYRRLGSVMPTALMLVATMWLGLGYFTQRPVIFSLALLALVVLADDDRHLRWMLPMLMWVWASVHGSFFVGLGYLALQGIRRRDRLRVGDLLASLVAVSLTAHGLALWGVSTEFARAREALDLIVEWDHPDLFGVALFPFLIGLILLLVHAMMGGLAVRDLWVVVPFLVFGFTANRAVIIAWIVLAPWFSGPLRGLQARSVPTRRLALVNAGWVVV